MMETRLREKRLERGLSQSELAYMARVPNCVISDCECGRRLPWREARKRLARALGIPENEIFPDGNDVGHN